MQRRIATAVPKHAAAIPQENRDFVQDSGGGGVAQM
jgi:hypothetical protein